MMKRIFLAAIVTMFAIGSAVAQETCESKAVGKDGKPLAGAAKTSFMKKCMTETCEVKAVGSDGKKLSGAAKTSFMKKCESGA
jgi:hypothetical protein